MIIDLAKPIEHQELNRKRNILVAINNLLVQIGDAEGETEKRLLIELVLLQVDYLNDLKESISDNASPAK